MGLDASLHIIYGYRLEDTPINDKLNEQYNKGKLSDEEHDDLYENLTNTTDDGLTLVEDYMCGEYQYVGLELMRSSSGYGEDFWWELDLTRLKEQCDDEKLDSLIQKHLPFLVGNMYDVAGLMNGQLPKLYFVKRVW